MTQFMVISDIKAVGSSTMEIERNSLATTRFRSEIVTEIDEMSPNQQDGQEYMVSRQLLFN